MLYAISARYGFLNKSHVSQINSLFKRAFKCGCVKTVFNLEQLLQNYDDNLLTKATYENHAMHHLLPSFKSTCYNLRSHGPMDMVCWLVLLNMNFIKRHLSTEFYLVSVIDSYVCLANDFFSVFLCV